MIKEYKSDLKGKKPSRTKKVALRGYQTYWIIPIVYILKFKLGLSCKNIKVSMDVHVSNC